jgi:hypothetical protein
VTTTNVILVASCIPILIVIFAVFGWKMQSPLAFKNEIIEQLDESGYQLIDISIPGLLKTGPFPKFRIRLLPIQTEIMGVSGEQTFYRIVKYKNKSGVIKESWIRIDVTAFRVERIKWIPEL